MPVLRVYVMVCARERSFIKMSALQSYYTSQLADKESSEREGVARPRGGL